MHTLIFDGSFPGLLTAVFEAYERRTGEATVSTTDTYQPGLLGESFTVTTVETKARRVWRGLSRTIDRQWLNNVYAAFLAEQPTGNQHLFALIRMIFDRGGETVNNYGNPHVLQVSSWARKVHRERHRMEAFVRFQQLADGLFYAAVKPDFNVLPLIAGHFKNRYADQRWMIYDSARAYGLYYDGAAVSEVQWSEIPPDHDHRPPEEVLAGNEQQFQQLWKAYFTHASIPARKNPKLQIRHVPKRYWPFLTEFTFD